MRVIGHRGAAALAPENTIPSFIAAVEAGVDEVEFDVRLTADGRAVVMHDDDVARTTDGTGRVSEMALSDVRRLDAAARAERWQGGPLRVPTLDEVLGVIDDVGVVLELKGTFDERGFRSAAPVVDVIAERIGMLPRIVVSSFDPLATAAVRERLPHVRTALTVFAGAPLDAALAAAVAAGHAECHVPQEVVDAPFVARAHEAGRAVCSWTVNDPVRVLELYRIGLDGIFTDDPVAARAALAVAGPPGGAGP